MIDQPRHRTRQTRQARATLLAVCLLAAGAGACAHGQAKTLAELPPLEMPAPPPRVVETIEPPLEPSQLPDEPVTPLRPRPTPPPRADNPRTPEPPRPVPPSEPTRTTDDSPRQPPPTTLQTTPTQREGQVERRVRALIAQATADLSRVNYQALNTDARNQYDMAKRFASQAEDAIRTRNLVFASNLADKAAALAAQLLGR